jgi:phenylacetate-CoA ligase
MNCFNPKYECMSREEMRKVQSERLIKTVHRVYENVPFYRKKMDDMGILPGDIKSVDDIVKLPFTTKQDLRDHYPFGLFAAPMEDVVRIHASSGTTGKPTVVGYTKNDIEIWSETMARTFACAGGTNKDIIQIAYGYGLFTGGLGAHYGAEKLGAAVVPISAGNTKKQIMLMQDFGTTLVACTPSYVLFIAETMEEMGIDPKSLKLKAGCFGAEPWTDLMRKEIENKLGILAIDIYGLSEIIGPGVSSECPVQCGLHVNEDHYIPEIIDPNTLEPLGEGQQGELVFTTVTKEALTLLRYRTRDISSLHYGACDCGRTLVRMSRVTGRTDDMLIIRGVNVFPSQIESVLLDMGYTTPHYQIIVDRKGSLDMLEIQVEMTQELFSDQVRKLEDIEKKLRLNLESILGLSAKITLVEPKTIQRSEGKAKRVIDLRKERII